MATGTTTLTTSMETVDGSELCHYPPLTHSCRSRGSSCCAVTTVIAVERAVSRRLSRRGEGGEGGGLPSCYCRCHRYRALDLSARPQRLPRAWGGGSSREPSLTFSAAAVIAVERAVSQRRSRRRGEIAVLLLLAPSSPSSARDNSLGRVGGGSSRDVDGDA